VSAMEVCGFGRSKSCPQNGIVSECVVSAENAGRGGRGGGANRDGEAGARVPIVLTSRADSVQTRLASTAVMALVAHGRRTGSFPTR
jgi:hypothetical protein